jgi:hypothetical protein
MKLLRVRFTVPRLMVGTAVVTLNLAIAWWGLGSLFQYFAVFVLVVIALVCLFMGSAIPKPDQSRLAFVVAAVIGSSLISLPLGRLAHEYEVNLAKRFCDALRPGLEQYRDSIGFYPSFLTEVRAEHSLPRLLRGGGFYESYDGGYRFSFTDPSGIFAGYVFDSRVGAWSYWD